MDAAAALVQIRTNSDYFLRWYSVQISGSPAASAAIQYYIRTRDGAAVQRFTRPGRILGNLRPHHIRNFSIGTGNVANTDSTGFMAHSVQMVNANAVNLAALNGYFIADNSGTDLMVTGQITGCAFVALRVAGGVVMTHIRPMGTTPQQLELDLANHGAFFGHPGPLTIYGAATNYNQPTQDVTVIGVATAPTQWRVYAQVHPNAATGNNRQVTRLDYFDI